MSPSLVRWLLEKSLARLECGTLIIIEPDGTVRRFGADGQVTQERRYLHGKPQGEWRSAAAPAAGDASRLVRHLEKWVRG